MNVLDSVRKSAALRRLPPSHKTSAETREESPSLSAADRHEPAGATLSPEVITQALTIRRTEERLLQLFSEGRLFGTVHTCIGQEWSAVAVCAALRRGDFLFSNHRGHGHYLAWTDDVEGLIAEIMGRSTGVCGGRGGSQHLCRDGFFSNGVQGGIVPVSAGLAMSHKLRQTDGIATVFLGDGTFGEGVVYEALNLVSKWELPLLFVVEDNGIAQSTDQEQTLAGSIEARARAFDVAYHKADTWHPAELFARARQAIEQVRQDRLPGMLHVRTFRLKAHSKGDDDRPISLTAEYADRDPLNQLIEQGDPSVAHLLEIIDARLDRAVQLAEAAEYTRPDTLGIERTSDGGHDPPRWQPYTFPKQRIVEGMRAGWREAMQQDGRVLMIGEDIADPYGGAFKVTAGLSTAYPERVFSTPISEAGICGLATGLALEGWRPIVEIMFGDFLMLAADQWVNHAAKFAWMYNGQVRVPMLIRTPMGGYRGYGPTHSQSLEKHLIGVPGTRVLAVHHRLDPQVFISHLPGQLDGPTLLIENKLLYTQNATSEVPPGWSILITDEPFPTVRVRPPDEPQLTCVAYGGAATLLEEAALELWNEEELACELILPTQLYPLNPAPIVESLERTGRLLVVEEGQAFGGWGGELIASVTSGIMPASSGRAISTARVHAAACPIPASKPAEQAVLPSRVRIMDAAVQLATTP